MNTQSDRLNDRELTYQFSGVVGAVCMAGVTDVVSCLSLGITTSHHRIASSHVPASLLQVLAADTPIVRDSRFRWEFGLSLLVYSEISQRSFIRRKAVHKPPGTRGGRNGKNNFGYTRCHDIANYNSFSFMIVNKQDNNKNYSFQFLTHKISAPDRHQQSTHRISPCRLFDSTLYRNCLCTCFPERDRVCSPGSEHGVDRTLLRDHTVCTQVCSTV